MLPQPCGACPIPQTRLFRLPQAAVAAIAISDRQRKRTRSRVVLNRRNRQSFAADVKNETAHQGPYCPSNRSGGVLPDDENHMCRFAIHARTGNFIFSAQADLTPLTN